MLYLCWTIDAHFAELTTKFKGLVVFVHRLHIL